MKGKDICKVLLFTGLILLIPLVAMRFTDQVMWSLVDFVVAGILLFLAGVGLKYLLISKLTPLAKKIVGAAIVIILVFAWMELAVGIFGTPWAGS